jgi:enoyl-CoA hydratase
MEKDMLEKEPVRYQEENGIARITLDRPEALNAINKELLQKLDSLLDKVRVDDAVKAVVITGAGEKAFSAGADIKFLSQASPLEARELAQMAVSVNHKIETLGKVVIAAINGFALGGGLE